MNYLKPNKQQAENMCMKKGLRTTQTHDVSDKGWEGRTVKVNAHAGD